MPKRYVSVSSKNRQDLSWVLLEHYLRSIVSCGDVACVTKKEATDWIGYYLITICETNWGEIVNMKDLITNKQQTTGKDWFHYCAVLLIPVILKWFWLSEQRRRQPLRYQLMSRHVTTPNLAQNLGFGFRNVEFGSLLSSGALGQFGFWFADLSFGHLELHLRMR